MATAVLTACNANPNRAGNATPIPDIINPTSVPPATLPSPTTVPSADFLPDVEIALRAVADTAVIFPDINTH